MNDGLEAIVERAYQDYSKGDLFTMRDGLRQAAKEAWEQATLAERERCNVTRSHEGAIMPVRISNSFRDRGEQEDLTP